MIAKPDVGEYNAFYQTYISKIPNDDLLVALNNQAIEIPAFLRSLDADKPDYRYGEDKWTIAEVLNHINDAERAFSYRAFAISRGDKQSLPGFDQDDYASGVDVGKRDFEGLIKEFEAIRASTLTLLESLEDAQISSEGSASGFPVTVRGLAGIMTGHAAHHIQIIKERYL